MTQDDFLEKMLSATMFVVEATSFETLSIWKEHHERRTWQEERRGMLLTVGHLGRRPVCISLSWSVIDGRTVMFWDATSQVVDHKQIEAWFEKNCAPRYDGGHRRARCDAMNFHLCIGAIDDMNRLAARTGT